MTRLDPLEIGLTDTSGTRGLAAPPVILRVAGLPAQALEPLTSPRCIKLLQDREPLEEELREIRQSMVGAIDDALSSFDVAARRFLLTIKRHCFNSRPIGAYQRKSEWAELLLVSPILANRIVSLEECLLESESSFTSLYESEIARERRHVVSLIQDSRFLRGVALGRAGLVQKIRSQAPLVSTSGSLRKAAKWEQSLLRFVTRSAAKLSANSTLTAYALGSVQACPSSMGFCFVGDPQREVSLVRADRPELEQFQALLMKHPEVRRRALIAWNDSVEQLGLGKYRFLRQGHWSLDPGAEGFHFLRPARITVELPNKLVGAVQDLLQKGALRYDHLLARLESGHGFPGEDQESPKYGEGLNQLVDLGFLILMPPWPTYEPRLEQRIGRFLRALSGEPGLQATADALDELLALEEGFVSASRPEQSVARMEDAFSRLLNTVVHLAGHEGPLTTRAKFFEDVLLEPTFRSDDDRGMLQITAPLVEEVLQSAGLVARFAGLFNHRHDILHTLAAWWREHEPSRREIPFVEVAQGFAPLWKEFLQFHKTANQSALNTFDPLHANSLKALRGMRELLISRYQELLSTLPAKDVLPLRQLQDLLEVLPGRYAPLVGSCVFVQPVDAEGSSWVLNRLHEGTGRYLSRITPILEGPRQKKFLDHLAARAVVTLEEEEADLLEVLHPWGSLVNAHPPQAEKVLDLRGLYLGLPRSRRVSLGDLRVQADLNSETFRLVDSSGRRMLPVNLSSLADAWCPNLLRFLLAFGPGETRGVFPSSHYEGNEDFKSFSRLTCGKLVLRRKRWSIGIECLRKALEGLSGLQAYGYIHDWRRRLDLPLVGFYFERTYQGAVKPQYVDFSSPSLCGIFVSSIKKISVGNLILEEALPAPVDFPRNAEGLCRGLEVLIDGLAVRA